MNETGIVRRIDELGRIVVPKELRTALRLHEGSMLEFSLNNDGLLLKKHNPLTGISEVSDLLVGILAARLGKRTLITCDGEVFSSSSRDKLYPSGLDMSKRIPYEIRTEWGSEQKAAYVTPIVSGGDVLGNIIIDGTATQQAKDLCAFASAVIAGYYEI